jgi:hypothetical protein
LSSEVEKGESIKTAIREGLLSHVQTVGKGGLLIFKVLPDLTETTYRPCVSLNNCAFVISIEDFNPKNMSH